MFSERLYKLRTQKGITQTELSKELNIKQNSYSNWEKRNRQPDYEMLIKIANYFNVSVDYLICNDKKEESKIVKISNELNESEKEKLIQVCKIFFPEAYERTKEK